MQPLASITVSGRLSRSEWLLEIGSLATFIGSLTLPAFGIVQEQGDTYTGHFLLFCGFTAVLQVGSDESLLFCLAWLANVAFVLAHACLVQRFASLASAVAAAGVVLSAGFSLVKDTTVQGMCVHHPIKIYSGYLLWIVSMILTFASAVLTLRRIEGPSFLEHHRRAAILIALLSLSYILLGVLLPPGKCALLR
jgi:hypothetical protein